MKFFSLLVRVLRDALADKTRRKVSQQEISCYCADLALIVRQVYEPDIVIAIDSGGSIPGELISKALGVPVIHLIVRRNIKIIRRYSLDPAPLRWIMSVYHHFLFQMVKPTISSSTNTSVANRKVLIVDDTIHTGATIDVTIDYLRQAQVAEVRIASLTYVAERKPDFSVLPSGDYCFPWSKDYVNLNV